VKAVISDPTGCLIGRHCEIQNIEETVPDNPEKNEAQKSDNLTEDKINKARAHADFSSREGGQGRRGRKKQTQTVDLPDDSDSI
jgi:hypothetical protein